MSAVPNVDDLRQKLARKLNGTSPAGVPIDGVAPEPLFQAIDVFDLAKRKFKPRETLLNPILHTQDLMMVFAARGIGKTHFAIAIAYAVAAGTQFLRWHAPVAKKVVYFDGELPGSVMQKRMLMHCPEKEPAPGMLRVFTPDLLPDGVVLPDVATPDGQDAMDSMIEPDTALVVIDNLSAWARSGGRENDAESWHPIADWILRLRRRGVAVLLVHHAGKNDQQRGTSKKEDLLDVVIKLARPKDYDPMRGAAFVVEFTKARNLIGEDAESLELELAGDENKAVWHFKTLEASTYDRVVALAKESLSPGEIAAELEINKSTVSRHLKRARQLGEPIPDKKAEVK